MFCQVLAFQKLMEVLKRLIRELSSFPNASAQKHSISHVKPPWKSCYLVWDSLIPHPSFLFLQISLLSFSTGLFSPLHGQPSSPHSKRYAQDFPRNQQQEKNYNLDCQYFKQSPLSIEPFLSSSSLVTLTHHPFLQYRPILSGKLLQAFWQVPGWSKVSLQKSFHEQDSQAQPGWMRETTNCCKTPLFAVIVSLRFR